MEEELLNLKKEVEELREQKKDDVSPPIHMDTRREIKFRFWEKDRSGKFEMSTPCTLYEILSEHYVWNHISSDAIPLQYTGIKDSEGCEIYEGDIVWYGAFILTSDKNSIIRKPGYIEFYKDSFMIVEHDDEHISRYVLYPERVKIIGNIYENPELMSYNTSKD